MKDIQNIFQNSLKTSSMKQVNNNGDLSSKSSQNIYVANMGVEPTTSALSARRSNQLS